MTTGMDTDIDNTSDARKTAIINNKLRLKFYIAALQETSPCWSGSIRENYFTFFWHGKSADEPREHGVGFAVKNMYLQHVEFGSDGNKRITTLRLQTRKGTATLVSVYAHTLYADEQVKDVFYSKLNLIVSKLPKHDQLVIPGDFNARVGADHDSWTPCLGHFGFGKMNSNGKHLLEFCHAQNLCVTTSFIKTKPHHNVSWRHPV